MDLGNELDSGLVVYSLNQLESITGGFDQQNLIGPTQFGRVLRGRIQRGTETQEVAVKTWEETWKGCVPRFQQSRFKNEIQLLTNPNIKDHPNLVKLMGYVNEGETLAVVYDLNPFNTLRNLILSDKYNWLARVKVALNFACLVEWFHGQNLLIRNIDPSHIFLDQTLSPRLFDLGMCVPTGTVDTPYKDTYGNYGYIDPQYILSGEFSETTDVFSFGVILLSLIAKKVYDREERVRQGKYYVYVYDWAEKEYARSKSKSLVHKSFEMDPFFDSSDGLKMTQLAICCIRQFIKDRPTMKDVVRMLGDLNVVQCFSHLVTKPGVAINVANLLEEFNAAE